MYDLILYKRKKNQQRIVVCDKETKEEAQTLERVLRILVLNNAMILGVAPGREPTSVEMQPHDSKWELSLADVVTFKDALLWALEP